MSILEDESLCARLSPELYERLNLMSGNQYSEFFFKDMETIYKFEGMDRWPMVTEATAKNGSHILLSLVVFCPLKDRPNKGPQRSKITRAHSLVLDMFVNCFESKEDHVSIEAAMNLFPTAAIFMCPIAVNKKKKKKTKKPRSIFDYPDTSCICAATYFRHSDEHTHLLWLATTLEAPPVSSVHTVWRKQGLATYLLCILLKQHTGYGTPGNLDHSLLSLQASSLRTSAERHFYLRLGFIPHDDDENGLSITGNDFQLQVKKCPLLWIPPTSTKMTLFRLHHGRIKLRTVVDLSGLSDNEVQTPNWKSYTYCKFPYSSDSMKKVESYVSDLPILRALSLSSLPLTDRPLVSVRSLGSMLGLILGKSRVEMTPTSWLTTDEMQFLCAFLMRGQEVTTKNVHVIPPFITNIVFDLYEIFPNILDSTASKKDETTYESNLDFIFKYIEATLDIFEYKFIVFLCNTGGNHWVTVVVINAFAVLEVNKQTGASFDYNLCQEDQKVPGWCLFNSNVSGEDKDASGFQSTKHTKNKASFGVRLFLNICASYLKYKTGIGESSDDLNNFSYQEPFGAFHDYKGSNEFPRLDFDSPSIIQQGNGNDCGLASIANGMAFVKHFEKVDFIKSSTKLSGTIGEVRYHLVENIAPPLDHFFRAIMLDGQTTMHYPQIVDTFTLLFHMRVEFVKLVDRIASDSVTDRKLFTEVQEAIAAIPLYPDSRDDVQDLSDINLEQQEAATIMTSFVQSSATARPKESSKSAIVSPTQCNLAESSTLETATETISNQEPGTQESMKKRRKSVRQEKRRKRMGYVLPLNKRPSKKPRRNVVGIKAKREEKAKADKANADALAYIGEAVCSAGPLGCLYDVDGSLHDSAHNVRIKGQNKNGTECIHCNKIFHFVCLRVHDGDAFCTQCYKQNVVADCKTETLFDDVFKVDFLSKGAPQPADLKKTENELDTFVDNVLQSQDMMTSSEYHEWYKEGLAKVKSESPREKNLSTEERRKRQKDMEMFYGKHYHYKRVMEEAKKEWMLSTDGVVSALRYDSEKKRFMAEIEYKKKKSTLRVKEKMSVTDDWVIDTYGKDISKKLMDREENQEFIQPLNKEGVLAKVKLDERTICRVKYCPEKYAHVKDDKKKVHYVTNDVRQKAMWKAKLDDDTVVQLKEADLSQFGDRFVKECKTLALTKFVPIPVGSCRSSLINIVPGLKKTNAPPVKFMQGDIDSCVFSSLASAFHQTGIPDLVRTSHVLCENLKRFCGRSNCIHEAKKIVEKHVPWLQPQRIVVQSFDWETDIGEYMFFVGVIMDSTGCTQHAVTIFRDWIYDSNEPVALPLCKKSLDCCTWTVQESIVKEATLFVRFVDGWIFKEHESKKKKVLDRCAHAAVEKKS